MYGTLKGEWVIEDVGVVMKNEIHNEIRLDEREKRLKAKTG